MDIFNRTRVSIYAYTFVAIYCLIIILTLIFSNGLLDPAGKPIGTDFLAHYAGSQLALGGEAAQAYEYDRIRAVEAQVIGAEPPPLYWLYPPTFFLFVLPLALFPYIAALTGWMAATGLGYVAVVRRTFPDRLTLPVTLAFPGTLQNLLQGQNGFLTAVLLGGGLVLLDRRPFAAGVVLGLATFKPHLSLLVPVALLAGRRKAAFAGYICGALGLAAASAVVLGWEVWAAYFRKIMFAGEILQQGGAPLFKAPTTFALARLLGADLVPARFLHGLVAVAALAAVAWVWSRQAVSAALKSAAVVTGCLLFTPSAYDYDLAILAIPIAWVAAHMSASGRNPAHVWVLAAGWIMPLAAPLIAAGTGVQIGPLVLLALLWVIMARAKREIGAD